MAPKETAPSKAPALCASCDRCRARKTRCNGENPCSNCVSKYLKLHKLDSAEGIPPQEFDCIYSPAKRRGPIPGRQRSKQALYDTSQMTTTTILQQQPQQQPQMFSPPEGLHTVLSTTPSIFSNTVLSNATTTGLGMATTSVLPNTTHSMLTTHTPPTSLLSNNNNGATTARNNVVQYLTLLRNGNAQGDSLRSHFHLAIQQLFQISSDSPSQAVKFAHLALGALVANQTALACELANASVKSAPQEPEALFWLALFRFLRGDWDRYLAYRRVCIGQLTEKSAFQSRMMGAFSYLDCWAYMMHNEGSDPIDAPAPTVYLNTQAPWTARALDALSYCLRTNVNQAVSGATGINTPPELCPRNLVLSTYSMAQTEIPNPNLLLMISCMDASLERDFTDAQIQSLFHVAHAVTNQPLLLWMSYHLVSNVAVLIAHLLNHLHATKLQAPEQFQGVEESLYQQAWDHYTSLRGLLTRQYRMLPSKLRCHALPRPNSGVFPGKPLVNLGETLLCACRSCQGFVLAAGETCNPKMEAIPQLEEELDVLGSEFEVDDDALLGMISHLVP